MMTSNMDPQNKVIKEKSLSPSVNVVDSSPLQPAMEKNRESLKIKLMVRRSANQLVEQGILPSLKTSPAIHEQKRLLERAKTGDLLKAKIQQRPNREELERRHILESHESHIDPSLADKYRMLEKAILVDQLNSKISHRPGPLELIEKNILHTNEPIERIVKEGLVPFKLSTDNTLFEDDSQSSEGDATQSESSILIKSETIAAPTQHQIQPVNLNVISLNLPIQTSIIGQNNLIPSLSLKVPACTSLEHDAITLPCIVATDNIISAQSINEQPTVTTLERKPSLEGIKKEFKSSVANEGTNIKQHISSFITNNQKYSNIGKEKSRKKCKIKPVSKIKAIKFHEYKGPPNAKSSMNSSTATAASTNNNSNKKTGETNYELIMQQQCLLEYLEGIYKSNSNSVRENSISVNVEPDLNQKKHCPEECTEMVHEEPRISETTVKKPFITIFPSKSTATVNVLPDIDLLSTDSNKLNKMKVSELKAYLKKLNLPVSGPKPLLIERLKNYLPSKASTSSTIALSPEKCENSSEINDMQLTNSLADSDLEIKSNFSDDNDIVREQQRQIEELQRKLLESQSELEKIKLNQNEPVSETPIKNDKIFQIIPNTSNNLPRNVLYDANYQLPGKLSTVFVVGVAGLNPTANTTTSVTQECPSIPMLIHEEIVASQEEPKIIESLVIPPENKFFINTSQNDTVENHTSYNDSPIVQDDINDVLEILLKNEKWSNEGENSAINFTDNNLITDSTKHQTSEPLSASTICFASETPLKFAENDTGPLDVLKSTDFESGTDLVDNISDFPMEIEENSNICMQSENNNEQISCFSKNKEMEDNSQFNIFDGFGSSAVDTIKSNSADKINNGFNGIRNSLIGNFDNGLFDTFKSNIMNSNIINSSFLNNNFEQKDIKSSEKLYNGFDIFGNTAITENAAPMEIENILSYDLYQHDPFSFNVNHNNNNNNNYSNSQQNDTFTTNHHHTIEPSSEMFCDDDNLFDTEKVLKW
ncbi:Myocardin [Polypedilum vanderplanki]|uniref:Myocardin n=1 Tax=Polypedilum vanderplanki TaxID=319348 RepID=A0A9J6CJG3_POLVA|nr:Myocardin [Polypedilum vanderplanki]